MGATEYAVIKQKERVENQKQTEGKRVKKSLNGTAFIMGRDLPQKS
jgi:hypothetical protein